MEKGIKELDDGFALSRWEFFHLPETPLAVQSAGVGFFYYQSDHQGSITHLTDSSGLVANSYQYDSYGRTLTLSETIPQPFTYTARELDTESGLYYYRARYYDPQPGRFLSEDPIGFRSEDGNLYRYVRNNPLNVIDPFGLQAANNPGDGAGGIVDLATGIFKFTADNIRTNNLLEAVEAFENSLEAGETVDVQVLYDPVTGEIIAVVEVGSLNIMREGIRKTGPIEVTGPSNNLIDPGPPPQFPPRDLPEDKPPC